MTLAILESEGPDEIYATRMPPLMTSARPPRL